MSKYKMNLFAVLSLSFMLAACGGGGGDAVTINPTVTNTGDTNNNTGIVTTDWTTYSVGIPSGINAVAWNGSKYLAVTDSGNAISSTDGMNWNTKSPASGAGGNDVVWGNGLFVSVGTWGSIKTSPDGVTWTSRSSCGCFDELMSVAWSGTQFVAAGEGGRIYTSSDGVSWTQQNSGVTTDTFWDVASSPAVSVAVGSVVRYSTDGIIWNAPTFDVAPSSSFSSALWTGSQFVINGFTESYTSANGVNWTRISTGTYIDAMVWDGIKYLAASLYGTFVSTDLASWSNVFTYTNHSFNDLIYVSGQGQYLLAGYNSWTMDSGWIATSSDASNWTLRVSSDPKMDVIWDGVKFVALDKGGRLFTSADGLVWSSTTGIQVDYGSEGFYALAYSPTLGRYVAASNNKIVSSDDGVSWTQRYTATLLEVKSVFWTGSRFIAAGWNGAYLSSADGITWVNKGLPSGTHAEDAAWSESLGLSVAVSNSSTNNVFTSTDEITWNALSVAAPNGLFGIVWTGTSFVAVGSSGTIVTSRDGATWVNRSIASGPTFYDVQVAQGKLIAVGTAGKVYVSLDDGVSWAAQTTDTTNTLYAVAGSPTRTVAMGNVGTIIAR